MLALARRREELARASAASANPATSSSAMTPPHVEQSQESLQPVSGNQVHRHPAAEKDPRDPVQLELTLDEGAKTGESTARDPAIEGVPSDERNTRKAGAKTEMNRENAAPPFHSRARNKPDIQPLSDQASATKPDIQSSSDQASATKPITKPLLNQPAVVKTVTKPPSNQPSVPPPATASTDDSSEDDEDDGKLITRA